MPIELKQGSLFDSKCQVLVNPVNLRRTVGAGLAKEFKRRFPLSMFYRYLELINKGELRIGQLGLWTPDNCSIPQVLFFPTKDDWRSPSRPEYIEAGLKSMRAWVQGLQNNSGIDIAMPPLGCGLGGLSWSDPEFGVRFLIRRYLGDLPVRIELYEPFDRQAAANYKGLGAASSAAPASRTFPK